MDNQGSISSRQSNSYFRIGVLHVVLFSLYFSGGVPTAQAGCIYNPAIDDVICAPVAPPVPFVPPVNFILYNTQSQAQAPETGAPQVCVGNPCNPLTGNKFQVETDGVHPFYGRFLMRYYNSAASSDAGFGVGWSSFFTRRLVFESSTSVLIHRGDGGTERWHWLNSRWQGNLDSQLYRLQPLTGVAMSYAC